MSRLKTLLGRIAPDLFPPPEPEPNPNDIVGACPYCNEAVSRGEASFDARGRCFHARCDQEARMLKIDTVKSEEVFRHVSQFARELPGMMHALNRAIDDIPEAFGSYDVIQFVIKLERAARENPRFDERTRRLVMENFRVIKQDLFPHA